MGRSPAPAPDPAHLLENAAWLRRLAARVVGPSDADADDLVQDTWVQAMRSPPPEGTPQGPWLARVARNVFRMNLRRRQVRRKHAAAEAAAVADGAGGAALGADELLARLEAQRLLARTVAELGEPFRTTVLLRYYEGMSAASIARATGVPAGTVRWRLKEGLDRIRTALDAANGNDTKRWRRALLPLVQGAWLMKKTGSIAAIVALLLVLGGLGVYLAHRAGGGSEKPTAAPSAAPNAPTHAAPTPAAPTPTPSAPTAAATRDAPMPLTPARLVVDPNATAGAFAGRVMGWGDNRPVAGAQLTFNWGGTAVSLATTGDGAFTFEPREPGRYVLQLITAPDYLPFAPAWDASPIAFESRPGVRVEGITLYLSPAIDYVATVVDPSGRPVANAKARLVNARSGEQTLEHIADEFTADGKGEFVFHAPDYSLVEARHPDWALGRAVLDGGVQITHKMTIHLGARDAADPALGTARIAGRVVDDTGAPIGGAVVSALPANVEMFQRPWAEDMTGDDGRFTLTGLDPGAHGVDVRADGYPFVRREGIDATPAGAPPITITLPTGAALTGRVLDPGGDPVPSFTLHIGRIKDGLLEETLADRAFIDPDGRFQLSDLLPGPARLSVNAYGFAPATRIAVDIPARPAVGGPVEVHLPRGGRLTGRVIDRASGTALEHARVSVEGSIGDGSSAVPFVASTTTAVDGTFQLSGLAPGRRAVTVGAFAHHSRIIGGLDVAEGGIIGPLEIDLAATAEGEEPRLEFVGIGAQLESGRDSLIINKVFPDGGAAQVGLVEGDQILAIDGTPVTSVGMNGAIQLIRGPEGTTVLLTLRRAGNTAPVDVVVPRKRIRA